MKRRTATHTCRVDHAGGIVNRYAYAVCSCGYLGPVRRGQHLDLAYADQDKHLGALLEERHPDVEQHRRTTSYHYDGLQCDNCGHPVPEFKRLRYDRNKNHYCVDDGHYCSTGCYDEHTGEENYR